MKKTIIETFEVSDNSLVYCIQSNYLFGLFKNKKIIVGSVFYQRFPNCSVVMNVYNLKIEPDLRNRGYGTKLIQKLIEEFNKNKIRVINVTINSSNEASLKLFKKLGFVETNSFVNFKTNNTIKILTYNYE